MRSSAHTHQDRRAARQPGKGEKIEGKKEGKKRKSEAVGEKGRQATRVRDHRTRAKKEKKTTHRKKKGTPENKEIEKKRTTKKKESAEALVCGRM